MTSESNGCFETIWENILHQLVFDLCVLLLDGMLLIIKYISVKYIFRESVFVYRSFFLFCFLYVIH